MDVVVPVFNGRPEWLAEAVASALACPGTARVIVVDDGSDPPVRLDGADRRVLLVRQANAGPSAARNAGLERTSADWVLLLDADDAAVPAGVAAMVCGAERLGAVAAVAARDERGPDGTHRHRPAPREWVGRTLPKAADVFRPIALFGASGCLVHRRVLRAGVRFDAALWIGEDRDFLRRAADVGPIAVCGEPAVRVRIHREGTNLTGRSHFARRVRDHLVMLERWGEADAEPHLREATAWLLRAASKADIDARSWGALVAACRERGWPIPFKARARRAAVRLAALVRPRGPVAGARRPTTMAENAPSQ